MASDSAMLPMAVGTAPAAPALPTTLHTPPDTAAYTPLAEHEARTPASFFDGPPVLHFAARGAHAHVAHSQRSRLPWGEAAEVAEAAGTSNRDGVSEGTPAAANTTLGDVAHAIDVWVGSDALVLFCPAAGRGLALPYPVMGLHALQAAPVPTVYMQLELDGPGDAGETVELRLRLVGEGAATDTAAETARLYAALSACADLHPDPVDDDDDDAYPSFFDQYDHDDGDDGDGDGPVWEDDALAPVDGFEGVFRGATAATDATDLPPPLPGSSGWITAENAHTFFDADGNWLGRGGAGPLGDGAGRVRDRDETAAAAAAHGNGADAGQTNGDGAESKRARTT